MIRNVAAELRPELHAVVQEARDVDRKFIAELVMPMWPSETRTGDYVRIKKGSGGLLMTEGSDNLLRAPGTGYKRTGRTTEKQGYSCVDRGLEEPVDDVNRADVARFFDAESTSAKLCDRNVRIAYEMRVASQIYKPAIWGTNDASVEYTEANLATIDFAKDLKAAVSLVNKRGEQANTLILNKTLWDLVSVSKLLREFFFGTSAGAAMITTQLIAEKFGLSQVLVPECSYSTAKKGKEVSDANLSYIWGEDYFWVGEVKGGAPEEGGAGRTMVWTGDTGGELFVVETYRQEEIRSDVVRVRQNTDEHVINECAGTLVTTGYVAPA